MLSVHELLNQIWALFRQVGIADDLTISSPRKIRGGIGYQ